MPRGVVKAISGPGIAYGTVGTLGNMAVQGSPFAAPWIPLAALPLQSPRLMGEVAYAAGRASNLRPPAGTGLAAFQAGRMTEEQQ